MQTIYSANCRSWYKAGKEDGRVIGLWPGSCLHAIRAFEHPRWEDYNYEHLDAPMSNEGKKGKNNRFYWLGNGATYDELHDDGDCAWYLDDSYIDYPLGK